MAQSPINLLLIQFNAIELKDWIDLVDQPYGGSGKPSQQRKLISLIWFVGGVSWSAHNSLSFNQKKFDWLKRIDCRPSSSAFLCLQQTKDFWFVEWRRAGKKNKQTQFHFLHSFKRMEWNGFGFSSWICLWVPASN